MAFMPVYREINESFDALEAMGAEVVRYSRQVDVRLPGKGN